MKEKVKKLMPDILELAKKLPKGSKMEIEMPDSSGDAGEKESDDDGLCPHCGSAMPEKPKEMDSKELRKKLKG